MSRILSRGGDSDEQASNYSDRLIIVFDIVAAASFVSLALTLTPAVFSANVRRSKSWYSMIATLMIFPLLYLVNVGSQFNDDSSPPFGLCVLQAGFSYAGPPACTVAVLCFLIDTTLGLRARLYNFKRSKAIMATLLVAPSIIFAVVFFEAIALFQGHRSVYFDSAHMFCASQHSAPQYKISALLTVISLFLTLVSEGWAVYLLYRNWALVKACRNSPDFQLSSVVRLGAFTIVVGFAAVVGAVAMPDSKMGGGLWNIFMISVPLLAALAFGTRRDILLTYAFWQRTPKLRMEQIGDGNLKV
ncbi:hypothetical protein FB45DRAFT_315140 [Roridomyces roridus]|uniref:Uncharacterized protein n=1 Tax=Roridomyces roridus TaxID=1738132 RepID=A0AAD7B605_9AGAR|nr:hypothetical protein FB45DRAFT_315140 [Roridomyces roridus]